MILSAPFSKDWAFLLFLDNIFQNIHFLKNKLLPSEKLKFIHFPLCSFFKGGKFLPLFAFFTYFFCK
ncbi:MAG: hypothetical protein ACI82S_001895 [Patiriisocius sp.]